MIKHSRPTIFFVILSLIIFVFESLIMSFLGQFFYVFGYLENFIDALMLMGLVIPFIYFFSYKPLLKEINNNKKIQDNLMQINKNSEANAKNVYKANQELIKKTKELEELNKFMVGRELKMIELKKQILKYENHK